MFCFARFIRSLPSLVFLSSLAASPCLAQTAPASDSIVITATRTATRIDQALAELTVIDRAQLDAAAGRTLAELLAAQPGLQFWSNGGLGKTASVSMRGLESRHTLLLIDGVRYGSATIGTPIWDNIPLDAIERIEIVRGPLSALYGSDAVGGVVQIFTRRGAPGLQPQAVAGVGSEGYRQLGGGLRFGAGAFDGAVFVQALRSKGFSATNANVPFGSFNADRDGFDQDSATLQLGLALPGAWRIDTRALQSKGETQYDDGPGADARAALLTQVLSLQAAGPVVGPWRTSLRLARSTDENDTLASASAFAALGVVGTVQKQLSWENTVATPAGSVLALLERTEQAVSRPGAPFAVSERNVDGAALGLNGEAGAHHWQAALRHDRNSQFGRQTTSSLGYGFDVTPQLRLTASYGTSFVAPSFNQLYFPGFGNPNLLPEEGVHREIALRYAEGGQQVRAAWFGNRIRGYISSGPQPTNIPRTRIDGLTLAYEARLQEWTLAASLDALDPRNATEGSANAGRLLPRRAKDTLRLAADRRLGAWTLGASLQDVGPRFDDAANAVTVAGYTTVDVRARWALAREWRLDLKVNNVADVRYETVFGYNQPGREVILTLRYGAF